MTACPYQARFFPRGNRTYFSGVTTPFEAAGYNKVPREVVTKCTMCAHRIDNGLEPACVQTCIAKARTFGDLDDPESAISQLMRDRRATRLRPELGTEPSVYYVE